MKLTGPNRPNGSKSATTPALSRDRRAQQPSTPHPPTGGRRGGLACRPCPSHSTHTNHPQARPQRRAAHQNLAHAARHPAWARDAQQPRPLQGRLRKPGGHGGGTPPDPIPNSDVKTTSAYDTAPQGAGKSVAARSPEPARTLIRPCLTNSNIRRHATCSHGALAWLGLHQPCRPKHPRRGVEQPGSSSGS